MPDARLARARQSLGPDYVYEPPQAKPTLGDGWQRVGLKGGDQLIVSGFGDVLPDGVYTINEPGYGAGV